MRSKRKEKAYILAVDAAARRKTKKTEGGDEVDLYLVAVGELGRGRRKKREGLRQLRVAGERFENQRGRR